MMPGERIALTRTVGLACLLQKRAVMMRPLPSSSPHARRVSGDKAVTPHVAQNQSGRRSAIDGRTTRHPGYALSQRIRKRVEEAFGWAKTVAGLRKMRHRGLPKVDWQFTLAMAAYDLVRLPKLLTQPAA
jgi:Transposase DDE domain